jgi:hypothetical protein
MDSLDELKIGDDVEFLEMNGPYVSGRFYL